MIDEKTAEAAAQRIAQVGHNVILHGPPGVGKTMVARRITKYLPPPTHVEAVEIAWLYSAARLPPPGTVYVRGGWAFDLRNPQGISRPFRAPHHTVTPAGLVGNDRYVVGEVSLAHRGVLFLDEPPEFSQQAIEAVARVMQSGCSMHKGFCVPARFMLVVSTLPCPCGWSGRTEKACVCSGQAVQRYRDRATRLAKMLGCLDLWIVSDRQTAMVWERASC
jgi:magnesium chelatase family protein